MKYVVAWQERPTGSDEEYEAAQKRIRDVFTLWKMPASLTIHQFVARVGESGYALLETDEPADLQYLTTVFAPRSITVVPMTDATDAGARDTCGSDWRNGLPCSQP
ncbi:DUF3303 domain-containing protein [Blastococcus sp. VKM Ac-2987]|uniref:DUF3303 domain-containing protein n=1 Tax=Blastococcus sp. VKM Ac-2987 TaxID=3004141 RepID=UPI0022AB6186|nr:DUF3303 family protein [Blastococcus sp. VKM Ac-2987]MCZ2859999.1 DUF3303 family protein [Blastococcus sp. VKM Ac-2987]